MTFDARLNETEERLKFALSGGGLGLWEWDAITGQLKVNDRWQIMLGLDPNGPQPTLDSWHARVHPDDMKFLSELMVHVVSNPTASDFEVEIRARHADGRWIWIFDKGAVVDRASDGSPLRIVGTHMDVTARKQAEAAAKLSADALRVISQGVLITGADRLILSSNNAFTEITGYVESEIQGRDCKFLQGPLSDPQTVETIRTAVHQSKPFSGEILNYRKDGSPFWNELTISPVIDSRGILTHFIGITRDITARKRGELELLAARDEAARASHAKSEFLSSMSHELRTPLNWILGSAQLLTIDAAASPSQLENAHRIERGGWQLLRLIDGVLNLTQIESGRIDLTMEPIRVASVFDECVEMISNMAQEAQVEILVETGVGRDAVISVDPMRLKQVILNFLTNAIKYNRPQGRVKLTSTLHGKTARLAVTDTGRGIPTSKQARIFTSFERLGFEGSNIQGTGIGLVTTKRLVEAMGGAIGFNSEVGQGSTFWAEFELTSTVPGLAEANPVAGLPLSDKATTTAAATRPMVLCIEDDLANQRLMEMIVATRNDLELRLASTAEIGIELARRERPDLILMDIGLPGMDGNEALRILKADVLTAHIPVVAITARVRSDDEASTAGPRFDDYITKPFAIKTLVQMLDSRLAKRNLK